MSINLSNLSDDLNIIQSLNDTPTESASELKAKFDEAGNTIKTFINETLIEELKNAFNTIQSQTLLSAHPVGSYYWSSRNTSPATLFGGTWEQVTDRFILAAGSSYTAGATGGEATHTLTTAEMPSHTHGSKSLTGGTVWLYGAPGFNGDSTGVLKTSGATTNIVPEVYASDQAVAYESISVDATHEHNSVGSGVAHNNMPPYEVAYCWKRTA